MDIRKYITLAAVAALTTPALAADDFGIWSSIDMEKSFTKKFSMDFSVGMRSEQKLKSIARWDYGLGMSYKAFPFLSVDMGYDYIYDRNPQETKTHLKNDNVTVNGYNVEHGFWRSKHRFSAALTGSVDIGRFTLSLREKYQYTHSLPVDSVKRDKWRYVTISDATGQHTETRYTESDYDDKKHKRTHYLRSRLEVEYNIHKCPITPFASVEISNSLSNGFALDKTRYAVGFDWKINKQNKLTVDYMYQDGTDDDSGNSNIHILEVGYKVKF